MIVQTPLNVLQFSYRGSVMLNDWYYQCVQGNQYWVLKQAGILHSMPKALKMHYSFIQNTSITSHSYLCLRTLLICSIVMTGQRRVDPCAVRYLLGSGRIKQTKVNGQKQDFAVSAWKCAAYMCVWMRCRCGETIRANEWLVTAVWLVQWWMGMCVS